MNLSGSLLLLTATVVVYFFLHLLRPKTHPQEPPLINAKIPFIRAISWASSAMGCLTLGGPGTVLSRKLCPGGSTDHSIDSSNPKHPLPAFTLDLLYTKFYVINSASLVSAVQCNHKTISFDPFFTTAANRLAGIHGKGLKLIQETENGGGEVHSKVVHSMHPTLLGPGLDAMNKTMIHNLQISIDKLESQHEVSLDLHNWCKHAIAVASTDAVYGPLNPYKSDQIEDAFWLVYCLGFYMYTLID